MPALPVIAIFDVGKTNKKILLFNAQYEVVYEQNAQLAETTDEDGDPCEDLEALRTWVQRTLHLMFQKTEFGIKAINVAAYGASLVYIDEAGEAVAPLHNYLKPYPQVLQQRLYEAYGGAEMFAITTASPPLGSLNSGLQLFRIKEEKPHLFQKIKWALHLPQYLSYCITGRTYSDITSIGCHTALWDFEKVQYHAWVRAENILPKLAPLHPTGSAVPARFLDKDCAVGIGVHDSSAALLPYRVGTSEPFLLLSTGTWCIALNPFNHTPLTATELAQDCLCYLDANGQRVKAARVFLGPRYDEGVKQIAAHFHQVKDHYRNIKFDAGVLQRAKQKARWGFEKDAVTPPDLHGFDDATEAYYALLLGLVQQQCRAANMVLNRSVKQIFVDGGFSKNDVYMHLLAAFFPAQKVCTASMAQGTALGAALAIHHSWNPNDIPLHMVALRHVPGARM